MKEIKRYLDMTADELKAELDAVNKKYDEFVAMKLNLNMARGKPSSEQLDFSARLLTIVSDNDDVYSAHNVDCRNYGGLDGLDESKIMFSDMLGVPAENVIVGGNSSLNLMFDFIAQGMLTGFDGEPWIKQGDVKFICVTPGYDRHFAICEHFGIKMIPVAMLSDGPDMDEIERIVSDPLVKGIWCVPKYSNPTGTTYSDEVVRRFANLKPAAPDFRIMWDNAYAMHFLDPDSDDKLLCILDECEKAGNPDLAVMFASTSKITFPGGGIAAIAASAHNLDLIKSRMTIQTISGDKLNQLRHARMFTDLDTLRVQMIKHARSLRPKFNVVQQVLREELNGLDILSWTNPRGGYFVSADTLPGCAKRVVALCKAAGLVTTGAGATFPYGKDPLDSNIRIAPSFPPIDELETAMKLFAVAVKKASLEMIIEQM